MNVYMMGRDHEPTKEQCLEAAKRAIDVSRAELEERGIGWDLLTEKLNEELNAFKTEQFLGRVNKWRIDKKTKKRVTFTTQKVIYSEHLIDWPVRQKARMDAHKLRNDYPPEEKRIAGPGGGPIPLQRLEVEFVKSNGVVEKG